MSKQNEESAFRSSVTSKFAWCLNPITGQETQPHLLCRERSPSPSQSLMWVESATPHKGFCEVIGGNEPITAIHVHKKKIKKTWNSSPLSPRADWLSHCLDQFPKKQHVVHRFCFGSDSQRTGNHVWGLGKVGLKQQLTWLWHVLLPLMGSTTMGFYSLQNPLPETKTSETWDNVKPLTFKP